MVHLTMAQRVPSVAAERTAELDHCFHVRYGDRRAIVATDALEILAGTLPPLPLSTQPHAVRLHDNKDTVK